MIEDPFDELKRSGPFWAGRRGKATMRFHQTQKFDEGCVSTAERYIICQMLSSDSILLHYHNCIFVGSNKTSLRLVNYSISWEVAPFCSVVHLRERLLW